MISFFSFLWIFSTFLLTFNEAHPPLQLEAQKPLHTLLPTTSNLWQEISPKYTLNDTIIPSHYELELLVLLDNDPDLGDQFTAPGKVKIRITPNETTSQITLHSYLILINEESITVTNVNQPDETIIVSGVANETDDTVQFLKINLDNDLLIGQEYDLYIEFVAPISRDRLDGLYLSTYTDPESGEERRLAATQMESIHARKCFPCFDEPALKATFNVTIIRKANYTSLANSNLLSSIPDPTREGWIVDVFNTTVPMSTYLYAMVVSEFTFSEADPEIFEGKPVRVYATPDMILRGGGDYSAKFSAEVLKFYDEYFDFPYPLPKMDSVSIPQFAAGAMENYGLNLYRESLLIYYPGEDLETSRASVTSVLAHELGHQNFGDLVTMNWWTQIWLNEGFATYVANLAVADLKPEFRSREDTIGQLQGSMIADVADNSHPLQNNVPTSAVDSHVGAITYDKGASINRMTEKFLTEETFQKGLRYYLKDMQFKAAHSDDLFRNLDVAAAEDNVLQKGVTVKQILDTWTLQKGHPLLRISVTSSISNQIYMTQEKYAHKDDNPTHLWYVPITIVTEDKPMLDNNIPEFWLSPETIIKSYMHNTSKWIMVNQDATGYYRVLYDEALTSKIISQLESDASVITPLSRSQLIDDYFTLAYRKEQGIDIKMALDVTKYLAQEDHFTVWNVVFNHLRKPYNLLGTQLGSYELFKDYLLPKIETALVRHGVEQMPTDIGQVVILRAKILDWACSMKHPACFEYAQKLFGEWQSNPLINPIYPDIQAVMNCAIVASGGQDEFDFIFERYIESSGATRPRLLNALACAMEPSVVGSLVEKIFDKTSELSRSDAITLMQRLAMTLEGKALVIQLLDTRLTDIIFEIGEGNQNSVANIVSTLANYMNNGEERTWLASFALMHGGDLPDIIPNLNAALGTIDGNIDWMNEFGNSIVEWLQIA